MEDKNKESEYYNAIFFLITVAFLGMFVFFWLEVINLSNDIDNRFKKEPWTDSSWKRAYAFYTGNPWDFFDDVKNDTYHHYFNEGVSLKTFKEVCSFVESEVGLHYYFIDMLSVIKKNYTKEERNSDDNGVLLGKVLKKYVEELPAKMINDKKELEGGILKSKIIAFIFLFLGVGLLIFKFKNIAEYTNSLIDKIKSKLDEKEKEKTFDEIKVERKQEIELSELELKKAKLNSKMKEVNSFMESEEDDIDEHRKHLETEHQKKIIDKEFKQKMEGFEIKQKFQYKNELLKQKAEMIEEIEANVDPSDPVSVKEKENNLNDVEDYFNEKIDALKIK